MKYEETVNRLKSLHNPEAVAGMARFRISPENTYGISVPTLRTMAREIGRDHGLAQQLWASGIHEARILASMVDDPQMITEEQMEGWVKDLDSWDICDGCCGNLFEKTGFAYRKAVEWSYRGEEFVRRAGFTLMARLAVSDKKAPNERFQAFFPLIRTGG